MRTPHAEARYVALFAVVAVAATAAILATGGKSSEAPSVSSASAQSWQGLVGSRPRVETGQRVIVVLRTPSLGQRVAAAGGAVDIEQEQAWTRVVQSAQRLLVSRLALQGVIVHPALSFARVLDGFSAVMPPSVIPLVERDPAVAGVYPVRIAYPATIAARSLTADAADSGNALASAGVDGRGVTVAILDAFGHGASRLEQHGTEMAGIVARVAPGASVLPIRVAGWQPDAAGGWAVYARSDQIIAGLDRAVDPNGEGDAHDAARIALVALSEPFAGFVDGPEALAVAGARDLDLLVVAPAGNDGPTAAAYGDISGPGGAPDALTVGALDTRPDEADVHVTVRSGLRTLVDATMPLAGDAAPPARPRPPSRAAAEGVLRAQRRQHRRRSRGASRRRLLAGACRRACGRGRRLGGAALRQERDASGGRSRQRRRRARHLAPAAGRARSARTARRRRAGDRHARRGTPDRERRR